jgi:PQQ-dependent catabolism-associated beta-propeller protein
MDVIDTKTLEVTRQLESGPDPELMATDPKGEIIYIANEDDSLVTIMEVKSGDVLAEVLVGVEPEGMTVSSDSKYTVGTSESTSMAHIIQNSDHKLVGNILVDSRPREAKFTADQKELWVSSEVGGTISVIDSSGWNNPKAWKVKNKISFEVPGVRPEQLQPVGMDFSKDGKYLFVPLGPANRVAVIDAASKAVK